MSTRKAIGIDLPPIQKSLLLAKNFTRDRSVWRKHFFFDPAYRAALTRAAARLPVQSPIVFLLVATDVGEGLPSHFVDLSHANANRAPSARKLVCPLVCF